MYDFAMTSFVSKIYRRHFESMITKRESLNLPYSDSPGYEASEQDFALGPLIVFIKP